MDGGEHDTLDSISTELKGIIICGSMAEPTHPKEEENPLAVQIPASLNAILDQIEVLGGEEHEGKYKYILHHIPPNFKEENIKSLFEPFGDVVKTENFDNSTIVHLSKISEGVEALKELNKVKIGEKNILVLKASEPLNTVQSTVLEDVVTTFKLYIGHMSVGLSKEYLSNLLEPFGRIVEIEIYRGNSAFVHMEEEASGRRIIQDLNGKIFPELEGPLKISESNNPEGPSIPTIKLQLKGFPEEMSVDQIRGLFQPYGLVTRCSLSKSKFPQLRKAVVCLEQLGDIRSAIKELSELELNGSKLSVEALVEKTPNTSTHPTPQGYVKKPHLIGGNRRSIVGPVLMTPAQEEYRNRQSNYSRRGRMQLVPMPSRQHHAPSYLQQLSGGYHVTSRPRLTWPRHHHKRNLPPTNPTNPHHESYYDSYYQHPAAAQARAHYHNNPKKPKVLLPPPPNLKFGAGLQNFTEDTFDFDAPPNFTEDTFDPPQVPYNPHNYLQPTLNLPLGEREYTNRASQVQRNASNQVKVSNFQQHLQIAAGYPIIPDGYNVHRYRGQSEFSAVPFDYEKPMDPLFPPTTKPGSKIYYNHAGKLMMRGNRGGRGRKKHPGLGTKLQQAFMEKHGGGHPINTKEKNDQEYQDWLQSKAWLTTPIVGVVRPAK